MRKIYVMNKKVTMNGSTYTMKSKEAVNDIVKFIKTTNPTENEVEEILFKECVEISDVFYSSSKQITW